MVSLQYTVYTQDKITYNRNNRRRIAAPAVAETPAAAAAAVPAVAGLAPAVAAAAAPAAAGPERPREVATRHRRRNRHLSFICKAIRGNEIPVYDCAASCVH